MLPFWVCALLLTTDAVLGLERLLSDERVVFQTQFGDLELAFYPQVWHLECS